MNGHQMTQKARQIDGLVHRFMLLFVGTCQEILFIVAN